MRYLTISFITFILYLEASVNTEAATIQSKVGKSCDSLRCNEHELCVTFPEGYSECICQPDWIGSQCDVYNNKLNFSCGFCNQGNSNWCEIDNGRAICHCRKEWTGNRCHIRYTPDKDLLKGKSKDVCSWHHTSFELFGKCICKPRYSGAKCYTKRKKRAKGCVQKQCEKIGLHCLMMKKGPTCVNYRTFMRNNNE